jgi:putative FmdB family regulatory protein
MPLYEYTCRDCDKTFETLVFDGEAIECPNCEGNRLERLFSVPAKPQAQPLPMKCDPKLPPCGPGCCRL